MYIIDPQYQGYKSRTDFVWNMERDLAYKPEPYYAIFFDRAGHPIKDYVINCLSVAERFSNNGNRSFNIDGYAIDPATIPNGGYIRRTLFNAPPKYYQVRIPGIKKVIFNGPATIVFWGDGEKTVVKAQKGETIDHEKGLALAIAKYALGNKGNYYNAIRKLLEESSPFADRPQGGVDVIDRDVLIDYCLKLIDVERKQGSDVMNYGQERVNQTEAIIDYIEHMPHIKTDSQPGMWIDKGDHAECSNCGAHSGTQFDGVEPIPLKTKFCPNCGARMEGADDDKA